LEALQLAFRFSTSTSLVLSTLRDKFFNFVNEHLVNSKPAMDAITKMAGSIVGVCSFKLEKIKKK